MLRIKSFLFLFGLFFSGVVVETKHACACNVSFI